jgi:hypothetical protein
MGGTGKGDGREQRNRDGANVHVDSPRAFR